MDDDPPCHCECGGEEFESVQELAWFEELEVSLKDDADDGAAAAQCAFVVSELCEQHPAIGRHKGVREGLVHVMRHGSDDGKYWACYAIYSIGCSNAASKFILGLTASVYEALQQLICEGQTRVRLAACMALAMLSEVFSGGSAAAESFAMTPAMLESLISSMNYGNPGEDDPDGDELRHCAAGVLHNASNVSRVAHLIVQAPGMLESLQDLTTGRACSVWGRGDQSPEFSKASIDAVCIINNLAKHPVSRKALVDAGFLDGLIRLVSFSDNILFSLSGLEKGEDEVVFVASAMAAARLCPQERIAELVVAPAEINAMVLSLQHALAQEPWIGILWGVGECLAPLAALSKCPANRQSLANSGLLRLLLDIFKSWVQKHGPPTGPLTRSKTMENARIEPTGLVAQHVAATAAAAEAAGVKGWEGWEGITGTVDLDEAAMALVILSRLCEVEHVFEAMCNPRAHGILGATAAVIRDAMERERRGKELIAWVRQDESAELDHGMWPLEGRMTALCMGMHRRLGRECLFGRLDTCVWRLIVEESCRSVHVVCDSLQQCLSARRAPKVLRQVSVASDQDGDPVCRSHKSLVRPLAAQK